MSVFKCKMCGGTLEVTEGQTVATCEYCGTQQTVPKSREDVVTNLFNRANNLRLKCEFDKAEQIYEKIVEQDDSESEAHWGIVLCKYGIEYVEDPKTMERIPTCHRTLYDAITKDTDYQAAIDYADISQQAIYEAEARRIDKIQKDILEIVKNEEPFDVFICYKETDENGKRTVDSAIGNDIYYQLTQEGFKVFYAAITLEDKLGQEYEPYIFAALNSAKVMLVLGTKPEYYNAVWVKNEWSRFMNLMKTDRSKLLIPCYRDMDAYELPEEFAHLQAQDMSKIGFINDVVRGIKKVVQSDEPKTVEKETVNVTTTSGGAGVAPLLKRAFMFLEDGEWSKADEFCEQVLNQEPENAEAYLGKLLAELKVSRKDNLKDCRNPFDDRNNYKKAVRFADEALKKKLADDNAYIRERNENARLTDLYDKAVAAMKAAVSEAAFKSAAVKFDEIKTFKDAGELKAQCLEKAEIARKDAIYVNGVNEIGKNLKSGYAAAIDIFGTIPGWKDVDEKIEFCKNKIAEIEAKEEAERLEAERKAEEKRIAAEIADKKQKKFLAIVTPVFIASMAFLVVLIAVIIPKHKFNKAMKLIDSGEYESAYALLEEIGNDEAIVTNKYDRAMKLIDSEDYEPAYAFLEEIGNDEAIASSKYDRAMKLIDSEDYEPAYVLLEEIRNYEAIASSKYDRAMKLIDFGDYESAYMLLNGLVYKDSNEKSDSIKPQYQQIVLEKANVGDPVYFGAYEQDNNTSNGKEDVEWIVLAKENEKALVISKYALDCQKYDSTYMSVTWEKCSLRTWMNGTFLNNAFSTDEQAKIATTTVSADENPEYSTKPGNATTDKVFLLSITEAEKYFTTDESRKCVPTAYAKSQGAFTSDSYNTASGEATCWWWLRSPGAFRNFAADVVDDGSVGCSGRSVLYGTGAVRPAMWINLD